MLGEGATSTHWIGNWVDPRSIMDAVEEIKICFPFWELDPNS
jgi:hypothetical protein